MPHLKHVPHENPPMPINEIDILIGREPIAPEDAARRSAEEIIASVDVELDKLFQTLILSASAAR
jgi:hypothetical protein